jgi:hypothetical protein
VAVANRLRYLDKKGIGVITESEVVARMKMRFPQCSDAVVQTTVHEALAKYWR